MKEIFAGLTVMKSFKPSVPVTEFPTRDTHPQSEEQLLVQDLEEDPNFWDKMEKDDQSDLEDESGSKNVGRYVEPGKSSCIFFVIFLLCHLKNETCSAPWKS